MYRSALAALALLMSLTFVGALPATAGPSVVAASRCNSRMIGDYAAEIRDDDAHPPGSALPDLQKRYNDLNELLQALSQERAVLDSVCPSDADKTPLFAYLSASASYALALQSDIALKINLPCPPAAKAVAYIDDPHPCTPGRRDQARVAREKRLLFSGGWGRGRAV